MKAFAFVILMAAAGIANASEIKILATTAMKPLLTAVQPKFEAASGHTLTFTYVAGPDLVKEQILAGALVDAGISSTQAIDEVVKAGKITADSRTCVAQTTIGIGIRKGDVKPDLSTSAKFKAGMLNATSVAYATEGRSGLHFLSQLKKLEIMEIMKPKLRPMTTPTAVEALAKGEVQYVALLLSNILTSKGIELGAPFPTDHQFYNRFAGGVLTRAQQSAGANALIEYLVSAKSADALVLNGLQPCDN